MNPLKVAAVGLALASFPLHAAPPFDQRVALSSISAPDREEARDAYRLRRALSFSDVFDLRYMHYSPGVRREVVGFQIVNQGSPRINPSALAAGGNSGASRAYRFVFPDRARQEIHLHITDSTNVSGRYSHDNMFREIAFFPRHYLPSLERSGKHLKVTLPTGEKAVFDAASRELVGGVLSEKPLDRNRSRHQRHNPRVSYSGDFIVISSEQRGESVRNGKVWGQKRYANIHYPSRYTKPCRVSRGEIWDQSVKPGGRGDRRLTVRHSSDQTLFRFIERQCGWDLSGIEQRVPVLRPGVRMAAAKPAKDQAKPKVTALSSKTDQGMFGWFNRTFGAGKPPSED